MTGAAGPSTGSSLTSWTPTHQPRNLTSQEQTMSHTTRPLPAALGNWTCTCSATNPRHYDACSECQAPSWTCATCDEVNPDRRSHCSECDNTMPDEALGDRDEGFEMTYPEWINIQVGPRRTGGHYDHGTADTAYEVLAIDRGPRTDWSTWQITARYTDGRTLTHTTAWDPRKDRIITHPTTPADQ
ncbi:hypothetical protein ABT084_11425 [Streptomyces sp. NPDC002138]|uniref:hypothetical protein n=1 Tax=Streptomyces sp. NPDC002138 TaxID=3154410 RepID=UPI00332D108B